jgi:predicted DNA-binding antitoxin AbrB/MazE fold protein
MTTSITAVFEAGLLRPTTPLDLAEGTRVELILISGERNGKQPGRTPASILAEIAALPTSGDDLDAAPRHWTAAELRKLPPAERDAILAEQAAALADEYRNNPERTWPKWM